MRDYIHVSDLADAHIAALKYLDRDERKYDAFNVGTGEGTSVRQIVDEVKEGHRPAVRRDRHGPVAQAIRRT